MRLFLFFLYTMLLFEVSFSPNFLSVFNLWHFLGARIGTQWTLHESFRLVITYYGTLLRELKENLEIIPDILNGETTNSKEKDRKYDSSIFDAKFGFNKNPIFEKKSYKTNQFLVICSRIDQKIFCWALLIKSYFWIFLNRLII